MAANALVEAVIILAAEDLEEGGWTRRCSVTRVSKVAQETALCAAISRSSIVVPSILGSRDLGNRSVVNGQLLRLCGAREERKSKHHTYHWVQGTWNGTQDCREIIAVPNAYVIVATHEEEADNARAWHSRADRLHKLLAY